MGNRNEDAKIGLESSLSDLYWQINKGRREGTIKKRGASGRVMAMLGYFNEKDGRYVSKHLETVNELYSLTEEEILKCKCYKEKTWLKLNEILENFELPPLNLPQEYTSGS